MKNVLDWLKNNILADIAILLVLISVGFMVFIHLRGAALKERMAERSRVVSDISSYMKQTLKVPSEDPNEKPKDVTGVTYKPATIEAVKQIQERMSTEARQTARYLRQKNQAGHELLIEGMLPETRAAHNAREAYIQALQDLLKPYDPQAPYVGLNAGLPPTAEEIEAELQKVRDQYTQLAASGAAAPAPEPERSGRFDRFNRGQPRESGRGSGAGVEGLSLETQKRLRDALVSRLEGLLEERAKSINIYADYRLWTADNRKNPAFPFQVAEWAITDEGNRSSELPNYQQLFEGQLEFWIQLDITRAIARANRVASDEASANVLNAPVKRLIQLDVLPGYVGLHDDSASAARPAYADRGQPDRFAGGSTAAPETLYPIPPAGAIGNPDQPLPDNFLASPTGRVSNALYDVRHARLSIVADAAQLPSFFDALADVNLMTIIDLQVTDVDEWDALAEGYLYRGDAVQLDLLIESIWLRDWTRELMPEKTKLYLGVIRPDQRGATP